MRHAVSAPLVTLFSLLLCAGTLPIDIANAGPVTDAESMLVARGGGRGGRGAAGARSSGGRSRARTHSGGASPRVNRSTNLQNRGNINSATRTRSQNWQDNRQVNQQNRQGTRQNWQNNRTDRTQVRQDGRTDRTNIRQNQRTDRQRNRQDFVHDNRYGGRWYGGGWYGGGYYTPPGWGWAGLATGLVIGAAIAQPPPYYSTVYVGSTNYIYSDGVYMQPRGSSYIVVEPPVGVVVDYLPDGCSATQINNVTYYDCSGIYYQPFYQSGSTVYRVVRL